MNNNSNEEQKNLEMMDALGNKLSVGSMVFFCPQIPYTKLIGKIVDYMPGGVLVTGIDRKGSQGQTPARLRIVFDIMLTIEPGPIQMSDLIRVVNPELEIIVSNSPEPDKIIQ